MKNTAEKINSVYFLQTKELKKFLSACSKVTGSNTSLHSVTFASGNIYFSGSHTRIRYYHGNGFGCESRTVPFKFLAELVRASTGPVTVEITAEGIAFNGIACPVIDSIGVFNAPTHAPKLWNVPKKVLQHMLGCVSEESPKNYGSVVNFNDKHIVSTDGFRLNYWPVYTEGDRVNFLLKTSQAKVMLTIHSENMLLGVSEDSTEVQLIADDFTAWFRVPGIKYPNYAGVIPKLVESSAYVVKTKELASAVKLSLLNTGKDKAVTLTICNGLFHVSSKAHEKSEPCKIPVALVSEPKNPAERIITVNGKFLLDSLACAGDEIKITYSANEFDPIEVSQGFLKTIIVPMQLPS